ncbi:MAG: glycosyltransferase [Clostridium sp.]|jgi:processive 1,2-diacylglycerol beta-glucosyltransferase|nr:glycosyltransferase [Clostridium sp.]
MQKKILVLTTGKGGGHKSSSDAIKVAILKLNPDIDVNDYDAMKFFPGYTGEDESGYIAFTTRYRFIWKCFFEFSSFFAGISNAVLAKPIYKRFKRLIEEYHPDLILSVHPCFVGSVNNCLARMKRSIPVYTCIIDLVKHTRLWHDKKCAITFVPTLQMHALLLRKGFKKEQLVHSGFPISDKFFRATQGEALKRPCISVLMVNPCVKGNKATLELVLAVMKHHVHVTVVTGSDKKLKAYLDTRLANAPNVAIFGYVRDMDKRLAQADLLIAKAGPNMILEAVKMCVPIIITGCIPGQEEENYKYIVPNGYGLKCDSPNELCDTLEKLLAHDCAMLREMARNEENCTDLEGAKIVATHLVNALCTER